MTNLEEIKNILDHWQTTRLTAVTKARIKELANAAGVTVRKNTSCRNCWHDALVESYAALTAKQARAVTAGQSATGVYLFMQPFPVKVGMRAYGRDTSIAEIETLRRGNPEAFKRLYKEFKVVAEAKPNDENAETVATAEETDGGKKNETENQPITNDDNETGEDSPRASDNVAE